MFLPMIGKHLNSVPQKSTTYADGSSGAVPLPGKIGDHAMIVPQLQQFVRVVSDREVSTLAQLTAEEMSTTAGFMA